MRSESISLQTATPQHQSITVNSGTGTNPGAVLYTLDNPGTFTDFSVNSFTAPSEATLDADTSYFVVMENSNTANTSNAQYNVGITSADGEDSSGLSDWDIDNAGRTGTPNWGTHIRRYRLQNPGPRNGRR